MAIVTTFTIMSAGKYALTSKVTESVESALAHLRAMSAEHPEIEPVYSDSSAGWRWTWEGTSPDGSRWSDTVRIY